MISLFEAATFAVLVLRLKLLFGVGLSNRFKLLFRLTSRDFSFSLEFILDLPCNGRGGRFKVDEGTFDVKFAGL